MRGGAEVVLRVLVVFLCAVLVSAELLARFALVQARAPHHGTRTRSGTLSLACGGGVELGWCWWPGPRRRRAGEVAAAAAAHRAQKPNRGLPRDPWEMGCEEKFECLPTLGTQVGACWSDVLTISLYYICY